MLKKWGMAEHDAEDVASEVSLALQKGALASWDRQRSKFTTYLYVIIVHKHRAFLKKHGRRRTLTTPLDENEEVPESLCIEGGICARNWAEVLQALAARCRSDYESAVCQALVGKLLIPDDIDQVEVRLQEGPPALRVGEKALFFRLLDRLTPGEDVRPISEALPSISAAALPEPPPISITVKSARLRAEVWRYWANMT